MPLSIPELVEEAHTQLSKITGLEFSTTLGARKENSSWKITFELVEKRSIPDQMDILGIYEVLLDEKGNLLEFRRKGLRKRMDTQELEER